MLHNRMGLEHVSYTYEGAAAPVLHDVSLTIRVGESIGIVGTTGAGRRARGPGGRVAPAIFRTAADRRRRTGRSLQRMAAPYRLRTAVDLPDRRHAQAQYRVRDFGRRYRRRQRAGGGPDGAARPVGRGAARRFGHLRQGERGIRLSGGERQRIGIARALYHNPDLLVFDEATSALDQATEAQISGAIDGLRGSKTLLVVAHRLSTVRRCDRLVFIADGRIRAASSRMTS